MTPSAFGCICRPNSGGSSSGINAHTHTNSVQVIRKWVALWRVMGHHFFSLQNFKWYTHAHTKSEWWSLREHRSAAIENQRADLTNSILQYDTPSTKIYNLFWEKKILAQCVCVCVRKKSHQPFALHPREKEFFLL